MLRGILAAIALSLLGPSPAMAELVCPQARAVTIVSRVGGSRATADRKRVRAGEPVTLFAVVEDGRGQRWGVAPDANPWPDGCAATVRWSKVEADVAHYDNARSAAPAEIRYVETAWKEGWAVPADVHPTRMHDEYPDVATGYGVMRFKVAVETSGVVVASPGVECVRTGALCPAVHTVAIRPDDTFLGYLHELFNTPYIYGSKRIRGGHQSDLLVGSDCADLMVYGLRRLHGERRYPYTYTGGLAKYASRRWRVSLDAEGHYVDARGRRLTFGPTGEVRPGDLLNFEDGHVGALVADDGDGTLDLDDRIVHTLFREPEIVPIRDCRWSGIDGKEVLRLR